MAAKYTRRYTTSLSEQLADELDAYAERELLSPGAVLRQAASFFLSANHSNPSSASDKHSGGRRRSGQAVEAAR